MQDELWIAAEQACGVNAQRKIGRNTRLGIMRDDILRVAFDPRAFHGLLRD